VPHDSASRRPGSNSRRVFLLIFIGLADCFLVLAYWPTLADALESSVLPQPPSPPPMPTLLPPDPTQAEAWDMPGIAQPPALPLDKAPLDDDTPVIGVLASGKARAYLVEAFEHGPASHVVNDVLGRVPISVTHCDISGCTRVFTAAASDQPLELSVVGIRDRRLVLKFAGHMYCQETSESLDREGVPLPCREYPAELTVWSDWRQAHPESDVYMGTVEEPTPPEAGGPRNSLEAPSN
jgi:hypothetical protein